MTSSDDPDQIRREIEHTQAHLSSDVNALTEKVTPSRIVARRVDRAKAAGRRLTDSVMGSDDPAPGRRYDPYDPYGDYARHRSPPRWRHGATDGERLRRRLVGGVDDLGHRVLGDRRGAGGAPGRPSPDAGQPAGRRSHRVRRGLAGLVAAARQPPGAAPGPASTEKAAEVGRPVADAAREAAMEVKDNLQEPAQQAVASVKDTASQAGRTVVEEGRAAAQDAQATTRASAGNVHQSPPRLAQPAPDVPPSGRV